MSEFRRLCDDRDRLSERVNIERIHYQTVDAIINDIGSAHQSRDYGKTTSSCFVSDKRITLFKRRENENIRGIIKPSDVRYESGQPNAMVFKVRRE